MRFHQRTSYTSARFQHQPPTYLHITSLSFPASIGHHRSPYKSQRSHSRSIQCTWLCHLKSYIFPPVLFFRPSLSSLCTPACPLPLFSHKTFYFFLMASLGYLRFLFSIFLNVHEISLM